MLRNTAIGALLSFLLLFSACSSVPDHASLIPKDAIMVAGIHTTSIGKKIAWDAIMGSKLIEKLKENNKDQGGMIDDLQKAGIKGLTTFYVYMQPDARFANGNRITALVPLDDANLWTAYVKKVFPQAKVSQTGNYHEALLANGLYAGWSKDMLIVINPLSGAEADSTGAVMAPAIDDAQLAAEMATAFKVSEENSLVRNKRFTELEKGSHDITLWINYDALIERSMTGKEMQNMMGGFSLSNNLWKDVSFAGGFDFNEGKIAGQMKCYMSEAMQKIGEDLGKTAIDKQILENLPSQDRSLLFAWHIAPAGLKGTLEKMGVLGILNLSLTAQGMNVDYILDAFSGDVALSMNEFKVDKTTIAVPDSLRVTDSIAPALKPEFAYVFAMKINKVENLKKLLQMAVAQKGIRAEGNNRYVAANAPDLILMHNDKYLVVANKAENATGFINGSFKSGQGSPSVKAVSGNPFGLYIHIDSTLKGVDETMLPGQQNAAMLAESKNLIRNVALKGGQFKDMAFEYDMSIDFVNKDENSLLQIIDFANRMNDISANK
jgi:Domain of unknown function (DUF4836)